MDEQKFDVLAHARGLLGMAIGGTAGFFLFQWLVSQNFYALAMPGALMGLACGYASRIYSPALAVVSGICAACLTVFTEWKFFPFRVDESFSYFLAHMHQCQTVTLIMFALGVVFAAWFGLGRPKTSH